MRKPSWAARVVSYWRTRRRWWLIHPLVRSTTQRRGWTMNPSAGFGPETMSSLIPAAVAAWAGVVPVYPLSAHTFVTVLVSQTVSRSANAARSWTFAGVACTPSRRPVVSTRMWRLIPSIILAPSKPRGPATGIAFTDEESTIAAVGFDFLPARVHLVRC